MLLAAFLGLAQAQVGYAQYAYQPPADLELQAGPAWISLTQSQKMCYVSGVLVGCLYMATMYDVGERPEVPLEAYYEHLYYVSNDQIVSALDRLYQLDRYWKVPIIVMVFNHAQFLKESGYGK